MKKIPLYQVDVFAEKLFAGNPAAVCPLESWLPDATLQAIAAENNLAETAYLVRSQRPDADFDLRWFTPTIEIELCGHATLASGYVLMHELGFSGSRVRFHTQSGVLAVERRSTALWLDLPAAMPTPLAVVPADLMAGLGSEPQRREPQRREPQHWLATPAKFVAVYQHESEVAQIRPDFLRLERLTGKGVIVTAPGSGGVDFVSRFFCPALGVPEDPATGSAHAVLTPYWAQRLGKTKLHALQRSRHRSTIEMQRRGRWASIR